MGKVCSKIEGDGEKGNDTDLECVRNQLTTRMRNEGNASPDVEWQSLFDWCVQTRCTVVNVVRLNFALVRSVRVWFNSTILII